MVKSQRISLFLLLLAGLVYFIIFFFPNSYGASTDAILLESSSDEYVTYPNVVRILTPGATFFETRANLFLYEDYHYGYPFYASSALVLLPVRLIYGDKFTEHMQLNLLLLRQFINVVPILIAAGLLVYLQTQFHSPVQSLGLFIFLLTIRGVFRSNIWWWHPDSLTLLCVVLTIFFLDRDKFKYGRYFYLAAVTCGMATAIKLLGVFFFLTIPVYLLVGLIQRKSTLTKTVISSLVFVVVMAATVVVSNPFLFSDEQRERMLEIQAIKQEELSQGYAHDDPTFYQKGPQWWVSTLEKWYAKPTFLAFLVLSMVSGCVWGARRFVNLLILTWVIPYSLYVLYFVAVKPDHYWLPVMMPLFSCSFLLVNFFTNPASPLQQKFRVPAIFNKLGFILVVLVLCIQLVLHLSRPVSGNISVYRTAINTGIAQLQSSP